MPAIRWLHEIGDADLLAVGGKAVNLARLLRGGFRVPSGFVIETTGLRRGRPGEATVPEWLASEILRTYRQLASPPVAVRSSATVEDSADHSFAGQGRTVLNVRGEDELRKAVQIVVDSADEAALRDYALRVGAAPELLAMHVVVQEMVDAEIAGVLFTANPVTGEAQEVLINATEGLGEPLVSGSITPDEIVADKSTGETRGVSIGAKHETLTLDGLVPTDPERAGALCLDEEQIRQLVGVGRRVEEVFGEPQDIEWAWHDGLHILQTRPLTTGAVMSALAKAGGLSTAADQLWRDEMDRLASLRRAASRVWMVKGIAEALRCPTPLTWEVARRFMSGDEGYGLGQRRLGFDPAPGTILERIVGHVYVDLDREAGLFFQHAPLGYAMDEIRENPLRAAVPRQVLDWRTLRPGHLLRLPQVVAQTAAVVRKVRRRQSDFTVFLRGEFRPWLDSYVGAEGDTDLETLTPPALVELFERCLHHFLRESSPILTAGSILAAMAYRELEDLLIDRLGMRGIGLAQQLTIGLRPNPALAKHEALVALSAGTMTETEFLAEFGHRCEGNEFELGQPRWRENHEALGAHVEQLAEGKLLGSEAPVRETAETELVACAATWGEAARRLVRERLATAQRLYPLREETKDMLMREFELLRQPLLALDEKLDLDGGIFYLRLDELRPAMKGSDLGDAIAERRRRRLVHQRQSMPSVIVGSELARLRERGAPVVGSAGSEGKGLRGVGVSPGVAEGRVRVITSREELPSLQPGEVLVAGTLEPSWSSAYSRAGGLVAEVGAALSHGAIVARELGVPAVVNAESCTQRLTTGQSVRVDGATGFVEVLAK